MVEYFADKSPALNTLTFAAFKKIAHFSSAVVLSTVFKPIEKKTTLF